MPPYEPRDLAMAEILPFTGQLSHEGAARLTAALKQAFAGGAELGPRGPQIRALGFSLRSLIDALQAELDWLDVSLPDAGPALSELLELGALLADLERLSELAGTYHAASAADAFAHADL